MPNSNFYLKLQRYKLLRSKALSLQARAYGSTPPKIKQKKRRIRILGDSLSDQGKKYNETTFGIPNRWILPFSKYGRFTNGFVWVLSFINELLFKRNQSAKGLKNINLPSVDGGPGKFFINEAEGGATAFKYNGFLNFFRYLKGWIMSFFLGNIQAQATQLKSKKKGLGRDDVVIIFAGANDLITVGYPNLGGAQRAVKGIHNTIKILTQAGCNSIVLATVPDIGKTPRFLNKSVKEREAVTRACQILNQGIRDLAESYQYIDFSFCDIYRVADRADINVEAIKRNAIVIVGEGRTRRAYFIKEGKYLLKEGQEVTVDMTLSWRQRRMLDRQQGRLKRTSKNLNQLEALVSKLTAKAKLNADIKVFDAAAKFDEIYANPEKYGFTSGCSVYFYNEKEKLELKKLAEIDGNAVILEPMEGKANEYQLHILHEKQLLCDKSLKLLLSNDEKKKLEEKLEVSVQETPRGLIKLVGYEDTHDVWTTHIVQRAVENYEKVYKKRITLANIYITVLDAIKENIPKNSRMSWDGLHPNDVVHFILGTEFEVFFNNEYEMDVDRKWCDDTALFESKTKNSFFTSYEAPVMRDLRDDLPEPMIQDSDSELPEVLTIRNSDSPISDRNEGGQLEQNSVGLNKQVESSQGEIELAEDDVKRKNSEPSSLGLTH